VSDQSDPIDHRRFAERVGSWLVPEGPDADVAISSRVRLARNLGQYPFVSKLEPEQAMEISIAMRPHLEDLDGDHDTLWIEMVDATPVLRLLLRERHLVSRDHAPSGAGRRGLPGRAVAFGRSETLSVMVNEEDHLRVQSMAPGLDLEQAWNSAQELDRELESRVEFAFSDEYGYLTGCPTNVGTGLRASVMLHLPALGLVRTEIEKVFAAAQRTGLAVRGMHGEGSRAAGDFYQISNQVTLGRTETQLIGELRNLVPAIVRFERTVRTQLLQEQRAALVDRVSRSHGMLQTSLSLPTEAALGHLSNLRLGYYLGLWSGLTIEDLNRLRVQIQRGHVQVLGHRPDDSRFLGPSERDKLRAAFLRDALA